MSYLEKGKSIPLVPKGNPEEIEVFAVHEGATSDNGPKTTVILKMRFWAVLILASGITAGYLLYVLH